MAVVKAVIDLKLQVTEDLTLSQDLAADPQVVHEISSGFTLKPASSPPVTTVWSDNRNVTAGTLDLTNLSNVTLANADLTGLKVQAIDIKCASGNAAVINFAFGAANPYNIFGAAGAIDIQPGAHILMYAPEGLPDVAGGANDIDVAGTGADLYEIIIIAG